MTHFTAFLQAVNGKKTYIFLGLIVATVYGQVTGEIDPSVAKILYLLFGSGAGMSLRMAIKKTQDALQLLLDSLPPENLNQ